MIYQGSQKKTWKIFIKNSTSTQCTKKCITTNSMCGLTNFILQNRKKRQKKLKGEKSSQSSPGRWWVVSPLWLPLAHALHHVVLVLHRILRCDRGATGMSVGLNVREGGVLLGRGSRFHVLWCGEAVGRQLPLTAAVSSLARGRLLILALFSARRSKGIRQPRHWIRRIGGMKG